MAREIQRDMSDLLISPGQGHEHVARREATATRHEPAKNM